MNMVIGNKVKRIIVMIAMALAMLYMLGCKNEVDSGEYDIKALKLYLNYLDDMADEANITKYAGYVYSENELCYNLEWNDDEGEYRLLLIYNVVTGRISMAHFVDMERGWKQDILENWEKMREKGPEKTYSESEIQEIKKKALSE